ncbi:MULTISPECIES: DUF4267 domain-containing protein [unclassified Frankia]|uniref:DUF4267 domain-containing protein n=1 Tax=unclassified Frankia TaxID=2632575 RepID=UPI001EF6B5D6|nr:MULTISPECIES: DUF4267 domain-containing protein [unclassified Frankia]
MLTLCRRTIAITPISATHSLRVGLIGVTRCAIGVGLLTHPAGFARITGIDRVTAGRTAWITRVAAVRELALSAGLLTAFTRREANQVRGWLWVGMLVDAADAAILITSGARREIAPLPAAVAVATAVCGLAGAAPVAVPVRWNKAETSDVT